MEAKRRGVDVLALLDDSNQTDKYSSATFLHNSGVPVLIDGEHAIAHNKVILIDGDTVVTGSFNFSRAAEERNAENLLVIRDAGLAVKYHANFEEHRRHSKPYAGPSGAAEPAAERKAPARRRAEPAPAGNR